MKIMIAMSQLHSGGAERVATLWCGAFVKLGYDVLLATNKTWEDAPFVYPLDERVKMVKCFGFTKTTKCSSTSKKICTALRRNIKSFKPDVIIGLLQPTSTLALMASLGLHCPVIATEHNSFDRPSDTPLTHRERFFKFIANKWFKAVTLLTEADKKFIGDKLKNVYVMPNPLAFLPTTEWGEKKKRIVAAGRLDAWHYKGFDLLICAWGKIANKYPDWTLDIAGEPHHEDDETMDFLGRLIAENNVKNKCTLSGFHSDMETFFRESEIFVLSSRYEGFGMVLIEAMSQGCACIACDHKGRQSEIIRNESEGLCVPPNDVDALASAIEKMISDKKYRHNVQLNAVERAKDFTPIKIARRWERIFIDVLNQ